MGSIRLAAITSTRWRCAGPAGCCSSRIDNVVRVTSYLRDGAYADANAEARVRELGGRLVPTTAIVVETLMSDWLVEIEVIAAD
jgi:enamine deaminase RidA (YjgF/YER057c/UK114 family)